jgi:hypothetical protein
MSRTVMSRTIISLSVMSQTENSPCPPPVWNVAYGSQDQGERRQHEGDPDVGVARRRLRGADAVTPDGCEGIEDDGGYSPAECRGVPPEEAIGTH